ncbi:MAG: hypothetical protein OXU98_02215 [Gammaproteobacteria bacterium]|nr:hypothetical protein [Gammaproteobacteria bacterium]
MSVTIGVTVAALAAAVTFIAKNAIDVWLALRRRKHLVSALRAYLVHVQDEQRHWDSKEEGFDLEMLEEQVEDGDDGYTPYIFYDPTVGFSLQDIRREYGFFRNDDMRKIVRYITAENYVNSIFDGLRTEYIRGFSRERKVLVLRELRAAMEDMAVRLKEANDAVEKIAAQSAFQQLRYALW